MIKLIDYTLQWIFFKSNNSIKMLSFFGTNILYKDFDVRRENKVLVKIIGE